MMYRRSFQSLAWLCVLALFCSRPTLAAVLLVTNTADTGPGSLRQAIDSANTLPGADIIQFNIPGGGVHTIALTSELPSIDHETTIDGASQPGYSGIPRIVITGIGGQASTGLTFTPGNCALFGVAINGFSSAGLLVYGSSNVISGCFIGTDESGTISEPNGIGILLEPGSSYNTIGGAVTGARNVISGNATFGIILRDSSANTLQGNFIGTDLTGSSALGNGSDGLLIVGSTDNNIGGTGRSEGNVVSGNDFAGIRISGGPANGNIIQGNLVGTDVTGTFDLGNGGDGIAIIDAPDNTIGGTDPGSRNVISGNKESGILVEGSSATGNVVEGNLIGIDFAGASAVPNVLHGISITDASENTIGGTDAGAGNLISGNLFSGVSMAGSSNVLQGNFIGTDRAGTAAVPNGSASPSGAGVIVKGNYHNLGGDSIAARNVVSGNYHDGIVLDGAGACVLQANWVGISATGQTLGNGENGIVVRGDSGGNTFGGSTAAERNVCSGNAANGILLLGASGNVFVGNYIGLSPDGTISKPNGAAGVSITGLFGSYNLIGGTGTGEGNFISGNGGPGIQMSNGSGDNVIQGNVIGMSSTGIKRLGNGGAGIEVSGLATNNLIGGTSPGEANRIAYNGDGGVLVRDRGTTCITISGNAIFGNGGLAINLQPAGEPANTITPNDPLDADDGPNHLQNSPVITNVTYTFGLTLVSGYLRSAGLRDFQIEIFANEPYGNFMFGEGQSYLGAVGMSTDAAGFAEFQFSTPGVSGNQLFAATATDTTFGETSEFSRAVPILRGVLRITEVRRAGANVQVSFLTQAGIHYALDWSATLPAVSWNTVSGASNILGTGNVVPAVDHGAAGVSQRFYRIRQLP